MTGAAPVWLRHDAHLAHAVPGHPERPDRLTGLEAALAARDWLGWRREEAPRAARPALLAVHPEAHVAFIESLSAAGGGAIDLDTMALAGTWDAALRAAGGAVALVDALLGGEAPAGCSALRPPGHHAEPARAMGFCFFNNVAVAARHATARYGLRRVLILDWDVHHGNGTNAVFHADADVLFVSIHESPLYPGTGPASDVGAGAGEGYTVNLPVPSGSGDETWCSLVEHVARPLIAAYEPELVLVSAGFDAHVRDPLATCRVTEGGYAAMAGAVHAAAGAAGAPVGLVLEGGYSVEALAGSMVALMPVLAGRAEPPDTASLPVHPLAAAAARRLAPWWPSLGAG